MKMNGDDVEDEAGRESVCWSSKRSSRTVINKHPSTSSFNAPATTHVNNEERHWRLDSNRRRRHGYSVWLRRQKLHGAFSPDYRCVVVFLYKVPFKSVTVLYEKSIASNRTSAFSKSTKMHNSISAEIIEILQRIHNILTSHVKTLCSSLYNFA